jgi:hypothetical protein
MRKEDEAKAYLKDRYPDWQIWYVPMTQGPPRWCAQLKSNINTDSVAGLEDAIEAMARELATKLSGRLAPSGGTPG